MKSYLIATLRSRRLVLHQSQKRNIRNRFEQFWKSVASVVNIGASPNYYEHLGSTDVSERLEDAVERVGEFMTEAMGLVDNEYRKPNVGEKDNL